MSNINEIMLDLSQVPQKYGIGKNSNKLVYDWMSSSNKNITIIHNSVPYIFKIIRYDKSNKKLTLINDKQKEFTIMTNSLINKNVYDLLEMRNLDFKFEINDSVITSKKNYIILNQKRINGIKTYTCKCNKCNGIIDISESHLNDRTLGCAYCSNQKVLIGFNDIKTTRPDLIKYLKNEEDGFKYTCGSAKRINLKCPLCSYEKEMVVNKLSTRGFSCSRCSDNISYSEKFMMNLLEQLNIKFIRQLSKKHFKWCNNFLYDFYIDINNTQIIIETHGKQHYEENGFHKLNNSSLENEFNNDYVKYQIAKVFGNINEYIELDCRKSELTWIKNQILKSKLPQLLNFIENDIDWKLCELACASSLVKKTCDLKNKHPEYTNSIISDLMGISIPTVISFLKRGKFIGWIKE